jgi:hypothetical protein
MKTPQEILVFDSKRDNCGKGIDAKKLIRILKKIKGKL